MELCCARLGSANFCGHHNGPSFDDPSSGILLQYSSPHDRQNLSHSEDHQNLQNLTAHSISIRPYLDIPNRNYIANVLSLHNDIENIAKKQLGCFRIESTRDLRAIEELEERKSKTLNKYTQETSTHKSWDTWVSVSKYIAGSSGVIMGASTLGWPGMILAASGGVSLASQIVQDTVGWKTIASYLTKAEELQGSLAKKIETGANYLSLGLGAFGGIGAYYTGTFALAQGAKQYIGQLISTSSTLSGAAAQFGSSCVQKKMSYLQADEKEMSASIKEKGQDLTEECKRTSDTLDGLSLMIDEMGKIVAASDKEQTI